ncbi:hypothetical protein PHLCEN_2v10931 [Hermanssonia centrifuga]|uniref:Uncharacterized protein n=1 Tax=Hermanssonia centrifuga TaxID=98765 RepID=A0A2R6NLE1_9APHY|nr:hypothetical protein PHLCEN_2v10931 [Hermanssonia centrifuga]
MAQGPPPSDAGPSNSGTQHTTESALANSGPAQITHAQYYTHNTGGVQQQSAYGHAPQSQSSPQLTYYHYSPRNQTSTWPTGAQSSVQQSGYQNQFQATYSSVPVQSHPIPPVQGTPTSKIPQHTQPPSPVPTYNKYWDGAIKTFLQAIGFTQTLRGFQADMLVLNSDWERNKVPEALLNLSRDLELAVSKAADIDEPSGPLEQSLDERKLEYAHFAKGIGPRTPTSVTKSISKFLAQNRARNDASNRNEFLLSLPEKRRRLEESGLYDANNGPIASCARTDAKTQNRDLQMKYDIAKNEDGPLRKTMKSHDDGIAAKTDVPLVVKAEEAESVITGERYPAFDERLRNLEAHLAVRYGTWIILDDYSP